MGWARILAGLLILGEVGAFVDAQLQKERKAAGASYVGHPCGPAETQINEIASVRAQANCRVFKRRD
jgi:hypothetical protein